MMVVVQVGWEILFGYNYVDPDRFFYFFGVHLGEIMDTSSSIAFDDERQITVGMRIFIGTMAAFSAMLWVLMCKSTYEDDKRSRKSDAGKRVNPTRAYYSSNHPMERERDSSIWELFRC